ncbi:cytochrome P450 [Dactylosporangium sp. CA-092794]|uniref:cytochrome P450 n=1 Tax=Dactylosporangium sp. CA-092794 TaxID=3239929 RepID=UPI003D90BAA4
MTNLSIQAPIQPSELDPYRPAALADPYPVYARLREQGPVVFVPGRDIWLVPGYTEVVKVLRSHDDFVSGDGVTYAAATLRTERYPLIESDPPDHNRIRRSLQPAFMKDPIEALRPEIEAAAARIAAEVAGLGEFDAVQVVAQPMPDRAMQLLTGLTPPSRQTLAEWSDAVSRAEEPAGTPHHFELLTEALNWLVAEGIAAMPAHCLGRLIMSDGGTDGRLDPEGPERLMTLASIWMAGIDSTGALLGNAIDAFIEHPDQWELLRSRPDLIPNAVDELLRYEAPFRVFYRHTRAEVDLGGVTIPAGASVGVLYGSANRDPRQFPEPDRLDITRENARTHVAFGTGLHLCLGQPLARLEAAAMLTELTTRVERFERAGEPVRDPSQTVRKFAALPVRMIPAKGAA